MGFKKETRLRFRLEEIRFLSQLPKLLLMIPYFFVIQRGATALLPLSTLSELLGQTDGYTEILVEPAEGISAVELKEELESRLPAEKYKVSEVINEAQIAADARQKSMPFFLISFFL